MAPKANIASLIQPKDCGALMVQVGEVDVSEESGWRQCNQGRVDELLKDFGWQLWHQCLGICNGPRRLGRAQNIERPNNPIGGWEAQVHSFEGGVTFVRGRREV